LICVLAAMLSGFFFVFSLASTVICYCVVTFFVTCKYLCNKCLLIVSVFHLCKYVAFIGNCVRKGEALNFDAYSFMTEVVFLMELFLVLEY
jgi:hypothetical protein